MEKEEEEKHLCFQEWLSKQRQSCSMWQKYYRMSLLHSTGNFGGKAGECTCVENVCKGQSRKVRASY